jgi:multicomponent Na+:H+ antiporter subunit D
MFLMVIIYSYFDDYYNPRFQLLLLIFEGVFIALFLTKDIFNIFVLLELATVITTILIMFIQMKRSIYDGLMYFVINIISMLFFLFGIAYLYRIFGVLNIEIITTMIADGFDKQQLILPYSFLMIGICLKSALFPLFNWLPHAHGSPGAPYGVSAILSGIFVKVGVYFFIVITMMFEPILDYKEFFLIVGIATSIIGFIKALSQKDLKLILAYHTISQVGLIFAGLSIGDKYSYYGGVYHIFNHAFFKSLLFLAAGYIIEVYQTKDVTKIKGALKQTPIAATTLLIASLAITGAPLLNGSFSKYWIMAGSNNKYITIALWIINMGTLLSFTKVCWILFGKNEIKTRKVEKSYAKLSVLSIIALVCILTGIFAENIIRYTFNVDLGVSISGYIEKSVIYFIMLFGAIIFYKYILSRTNILYYNLRKSFSFSTSCLLLISFFLAIILYGYYLI